MAQALWLSISQVAEITGWHLQYVRRKARSGELKWRWSERVASNGKREREYDPASLPADAQLKLLRLSIPAPTESTALILATRGQQPLFCPVPAVPRESLVGLSPSQSAQAQTRLEAIAPLVDYARTPKTRRVGFRTLGGRAVRSMTSLVGYVAECYHVSPRTLWHWYARFRKHGYAGLADQVRCDKGQSRVFSEHLAARAFAETKYLRERLSIRLVHRAIVREWSRLSDPAERPPSYSAVRAYLKALPKPLAILTRAGERAYSERCDPYLLTDFESIAVNQIWVSDHVKHDLWVRNDSLAGSAPNAALRPWLTAILDMRSRKVVGTAWSATPSSHTISSALRVTIDRYGIPKAFYIDNGKDYEKVGRIDFSPECSGVLIRLGITPCYCLPKHPQSKLIESWFATLHKRFDSLWPSYCGSSPDLRPEQCNALLKEHQAFLRRKRQSSPLPASSAFVDAASQWIQEYNSQHPHTGRGMGGRTPDEVFQELLPAEERRPVADPHVLDALFWDRQRRKVSEGGCVQLYNERYEPADPESFAKLFLEIERDIIVACDPANLGDAIALDLDGRFLGRLRAQGLTARGPISRDEVKASMRLRRSARKAVLDYVRGLSGLRAEAGDLTELDHLHRRTRLAPRSPGQPDAQLPTTAAALSAAEPQYIDDVVRELMDET